MSLKPTDNVKKSIRKILDNYVDEVQEETDKVIEETVIEATKKVKNAANERKGKYKKGIKNRRDKNMQYTILSTNDRRGLTHLLEHGHKTRNGGKTKANPHWEPTREWIEEELPQRILKKISE